MKDKKTMAIILVAYVVLAASISAVVRGEEANLGRDFIHFVNPRVLVDTDGEEFVLNNVQFELPLESQEVLTAKLNEILVAYGGETFGLHIVDEAEDDPNVKIVDFKIYSGSDGEVDVNNLVAEMLMDYEHGDFQEEWEA